MTRPIQPARAPGLIRPLGLTLALTLALPPAALAQSPDPATDAIPAANAKPADATDAIDATDANATPADATPTTPTDPAASGPLGPPELPTVAVPPGEEPPLPLIDAVAQGYNQRPEDELPGSLQATLLAIGPGLVVHGIGHFAIDEDRTGVILLITELTALALLVASAVIDATTNNSASVAPATDAMTHAGIVLFVGSWIADIVGAFTGTVPFDPDTTRVEGSVFGVAYRYTDSPLDTFRHHLVGRLSIDLGWLYIRPLIDLEAELDARRAELDLGVRVLSGQDPHEHLALGVIGRRFENRPDGYAVSGLMAYAWGKADLGHFMRTLRGVYVAGRAGYGIDGYQFAARTDAVPAWFAKNKFTDTRLVLQSGLGFNTGERTHVLALWSQDTVGDIPPAPEAGQLQLNLQHRYLDTLDIDVQLVFGDGFAVWLGLGYVL